MVSFSSKVIQLGLRYFGGMNPISNPGIFEKIVSRQGKPMKHASKKGYTVSMKETENKSRYVVLKKDNDVETKGYLFYAWWMLYYENA